jgi:hypothetical protein
VWVGVGPWQARGFCWTREVRVSETSFDRVIAEHLTLCERNKRLERTMPLGRYREHRGDIADDSLTREAKPSTEEEPSTQVNAVPRRDPDCWWETKDGECPPPPLDWDSDY